MVPPTKIPSNTQNIETYISRNPVSFSMPKEKSHEFTLNSGQKSPRSPLYAYCSWPACGERALCRPSPKESCGLSRLSLVLLLGTVSSLSLQSFSLNAQCFLWPQGALFSKLSLDLPILHSILCHRSSLEDQLGKSINKVETPN